MTGGEMAALVADRTGLPVASVRAVMAGIVQAIADQAALGGYVAWGGLGTFSTGMQAARTFRNPRTGAPVDVGDKIKIKFKPSAGLKNGI